MMNQLIAVLICAVFAGADQLEPSCSKPIFCDSQLLHHIQMARLYPDSKTFVDMHLVNDEETTLKKFDELLEKTNQNPSREQLQQFVNDNFDDRFELENWTPTDYNPNPSFLAGIKDETLRKFGKDINDIWKILGRKVTQNVIDNPDYFSLIPVTHPFIVPGGRFKEIYYWDTYWIIEGLLISGMKETAKGQIENLFEILVKIGLVPNGSRWYYEQRSQPPMLTAMVLMYFRATNDRDFVEKHIDALETELNYWLEKQTITFEHNSVEYTMLRYFAESTGPRPESYYEDYVHAQTFPTAERQQEFYTDIKSAAESGWDFSSRWYIDGKGGNTGNLTNIHTRQIIPVDLNAIFANALKTVADFRGMLGYIKAGARWAGLAEQWRTAIREVLWDRSDGIWYDYDILNKEHRKYFYPTNVAPLWMGTVDRRLVTLYSRRILNYLTRSTGLDFPGGVPASLDRTGEQWDFPNAWPPLVSIMVNALEALGTRAGRRAALHTAQVWVRTCLKGFESTKQMFEKYDAEVPGQVGGGGEYTVQDGFGWSNGVVLEFLAKYGSSLTAADTLNDDLNDSELDF